MGIDRPGIVSDVTKVVIDGGGNVGESHSQLLGGHFSLMMLVEIPAAPQCADELARELQSRVKGMSTSCFDAVGSTLKFEVCPTIGCECLLAFVCTAVFSAGPLCFAEALL